MDTSHPNAPAHLSVYHEIRRMILCGDLAPGQTVTIQGLVDRVGAGMTPVREAIRRLTSEGALQFQGNRRVSVPTLTLAQVDELVFARLALEPDLAGWAAAKAKPEDIRELSEIDGDLNAAIARGDIPAYMLHNYSFHMTLYTLAETEIVLPVVRTLWLRSAPSLRVMVGRLGTRNLPDMHRAALDALSAGDPDAVSDAVRADILQGMDSVRDALIESAAMPRTDQSA